MTYYKNKGKIIKAKSRTNVGKEQNKKEQNIKTKHNIEKTKTRKLENKKYDIKNSQEKIMMIIFIF